MELRFDIMFIYGNEKTLRTNKNLISLMSSLLYIQCAFQPQAAKFVRGVFEPIYISTGRAIALSQRCSNVSFCLASLGHVDGSS